MREAQVNSTTASVRHPFDPRRSRDGSTNRPRNPGARLLAVGGGKGGVGKTFIAANLATALARLGKRVVIVDADLEGPNLHTCLGMPPPKRTLSDFINRKVTDLNDIVTSTTIEGMGTVHDMLPPKEHHGLQCGYRAPA